LTEPIDKLIEDVWRHAEGVHPDEDADYEKVFGERVHAVGVQPLLVQLFRTRADSKLHVLLLMVRFAWRDLPFDTWMQILEDVADNRHFVYQVLAFFGLELGIDVRCLQSSKPNVERELQSAAFRDGGFRPPFKATRDQADDHFDYESMWRRLASEGAPMLPGLV